MLDFPAELLVKTFSKCACVVLKSHVTRKSNTEQVRSGAERENKLRSTEGCCACFFLIASFMVVICYIVFAEFFMHISHKEKK